MKKLNILLLVSIITLWSCNDKVIEQYQVNAPVYMSYEDLRVSVKTSEPVQIQKAGKIYLKDNYVFVNEVREGIHVIDNANPSNPKPLTFIEIPGNVDMAIKGNLLYADSYIDLVVLDIADLTNINEVARVDSAFPYYLPPLEYPEGQIEGVDYNQGIVVGWEVKERSMEVKEQPYNMWFYPQYTFEASFDGSKQIRTNGAGGNMNIGIGGSMARFAIYEDYLYAIHEGSLKIFGIADENSISEMNTTYVGWNIETLFPYKGNMFIGAPDGMYIYGLSNPLNPSRISVFTHARACDPVVVEGNTAYVTLRAGNVCGESLSQLEVIDVTNLSDPKLLKSYPMDEPYGLGIDNNTLFICDGPSGLKVYDATDPLTIAQNQIAHFEEINTYDVIPYNGNLLLIANEGFYQYAYTNDTVHQLSFIPVYADLP